MNDGTPPGTKERLKCQVLEPSGAFGAKGRNDTRSRETQKFKEKKSEWVFFPPQKTRKHDTRRQVQSLESSWWDEDDEGELSDGGGRALGDMQAAVIGCGCCPLKLKVTRRE